jgi:hypothetical protein
MRRLPLILIILFFASHAYGQASSWSKYIPQNQRKPILKSCLRATGGLSAFISGKGAIAIWVTEPAARLLVSEAIDRERIADDQADALYAQLRPEDSFVILIYAQYTDDGAHPNDKRYDPLSKNEVFLQRSEDSKQFSKGAVQDALLDVHLGKLFRRVDLLSTHRVLFAKQTRSNEPLIRSLDDQIDLQLVLEGKKNIFDYKLKEMTQNLKDL